MFIYQNAYSVPTFCNANIICGLSNMTDCFYASHKTTESIANWSINSIKYFQDLAS